jgi:hypothetical protein
LKAHRPSRERFESKDTIAFKARPPERRRAADLADQLLELHNRYRENLQAKHVTANALALIDALFENPLMYTSRAEAVLDVSAPTGA